MTNFQHGRDAEAAAAEYLKRQGYKIRAQNWRTRYCEIDIVVEKDKIIYFVEVKYRQNIAQGMGTDYVTPKKLRQMAFAAEMWVNDCGWEGSYQLSVIEVAGLDFRISQFLADL